jgi:hypothetical protein
MGQRDGDETREQVDLACTVCTEEFEIPIGVYGADSSVVPCPDCGSTDLVVLGVLERCDRNSSAA